MGYFSPPQNDSSHYSNDGWEYRQEIANSEHSNPWRFAPEPQIDQANHMRRCPEPQNDLCHYSHALNVSYSINQEPSSLEQTFNSFMQNYPTSPPISSLENSSSLDYASTQSLLQDPHHPFYQLQNLLHNSQDSFHTTQNNLTPTHPYPQNFSQPSSLELVAEDLLQKSKELLERQEQSWKRQEILFNKMDGHLEQIRRNLELSNSEDEDQIVGEKVEKQNEETSVSSESSMEKEVVEVFEPVASSSQKPLEMTREHENSQLSQTFLKQNGSTIESMIERYKEEMKKSWEDQQTSSMKELLKQMLNVKKEVEEQESEEDTQEKSHSSEAEKYTEEELIEPLLQGTLDEKKTPTITQPPRLGFKEVKAINKSTKKRIVTKLPRTIFMKKKGSTTSNPPPDPASKLNQAINKRKLAEERLRQGTLAESSPPLKIIPINKLEEEEESEQHVNHRYNFSSLLGFRSLFYLNSINWHMVTF
ncbi:hypothetical protein AHAS_Ahas15G0240300 [Arachis hypogaea]